MKEVNYLIDCLERTPVILKNLLDNIPQHHIGVRRVEGKWSVHEQVCHLVEAQDILIGRFKQFETEEHPLIKSYIPPPGQSSDHYQQMDIVDALDRFPEIRAGMVAMFRGYDEDFWNRKGSHEAFEPYSSKLLLTHTLNVDYGHIFSIEQLGLTKPGRESEIMTLP